MAYLLAAPAAEVVVAVTVGKEEEEEEEAALIGSITALTARWIITARRSAEAALIGSINELTEIWTITEPLNVETQIKKEQKHATTAASLATSRVNAPTISVPSRHMDHTIRKCKTQQRQRWPLLDRTMGMRIAMPID